MINDIGILFSSDIHAFNTILLLEKLKEKIHKDYILWHPTEFYAPQFMEYLEWNYDINNSHSKNILDLENFLDQNNSTLHIILGGDENSKGYTNTKSNPIKNVKFIFWPTFLLHYSYYGLENKLPKYRNNFPLVNIENLFMCLNGKPRYHRAKLIDELVKNDLFNYGIISWNRTDVEEYDFEYFKNLLLKLDNFMYIDLSTVYSEKLLTNVLFNVVTESSVHENLLFYTEKTYRTILIGQPLVILGTKNQNRGLEKYGFQLYDEVFDYYFDGMDTLDERIEGIIFNLKKYKNTNLNEVYKKLIEKTKFNRIKALEIVNNDPYIPKVLLNYYKMFDKDFIRLFDKFTKAWNNSYRMDNDFNLVNEILKRNING